jgi:asparagine synthase (glutamine-hydrolysing)
MARAAPQRINQAWGQACWAGLLGTIEPMLLRDAEAMGMACGLELPVPYLDHQLMEIALRMPLRYQRAGKGLLRQACGELLPPGNLKQQNLGLGLPMAVWMNSALREMCLFRLNCLLQSGWLHPAWIHQQWQAFETNQLHWKPAWTLVVLGTFSLRETNLKT